MTLLAARPCRLLGAPHGAMRALRRLQCPATPATPVAAAARSYADEAPAQAQAEAPAKPFTIRKVDPAEDKHSPHTSLRPPPRRPVTPRFAHSDIRPVDSAILIPASVTAAVSPRPVCLGLH